MTSLPAPGTPVSLPRSRWWDEGALRVFLAWPEQPAPPAGYPLLCLLDGHTLFGTAVEAARLQAGRPGATGVQPGVVLGLGHPGNRAAHTAGRRRDYTPPPFDPVQGTGGAGHLLALLEARILPKVSALLPIDPARLALFGHSLGGLVPLHALLSRSPLFARFVAASPSLWWADHALLHRAETATFATPSRLLLTVGGAERPDPACTDPERLARQRRTRMVESVHALAALLSPIMPVTCIEFPGENHGSVLPAAISRGVGFAFGGEG